MGWYWMTKDADNVNQPCRYCRKPVKAGDGFYMSEAENNGDFSQKVFSLAHRGCEWEMAEAREKANKKG